jgi:hypothetical protein
MGDEQQVALLGVTFCQSHREDRSLEYKDFFAAE